MIVKLGHTRANQSYIFTIIHGKSQNSKIPTPRVLYKIQMAKTNNNVELTIEHKLKGKYFFQVVIPNK